MAKINKTTENKDTSNDETVVSDITEIYNREWEEEPNGTKAAKNLDEIDKNNQEAVTEESDNATKTKGAKQAPIVQDYVEPKILESTKRKNYIAPIHSDASILPAEQQDVNHSYQNIQNLTPSNKNNSRRNKMTLFMLIIVFIVASIIIAVLVLNKGPKNNSGYQPIAIASPTPTADPVNEAIDAFINAIRNKDKPESDALQTVAMQQTLKETGGVTSFYDYCQKNVYFCEQQFSIENLSSGNIKLIDYTAKDGNKGKQRVYTITKTQNQQTTGKETNSKSVTTITIATVQVNNVWMIDYFNYASTLGATNNL